MTPLIFDEFAWMLNFTVEALTEIHITSPESKIKIGQGSHLVMTGDTDSERWQVFVNGDLIGIPKNEILSVSFWKRWLNQSLKFFKLIKNGDKWVAGQPNHWMLVRTDRFTTFLHTRSMRIRYSKSQIACMWKQTTRTRQATLSEQSRRRPKYEEEKGMNMKCTFNG